ncbi:MAG: D-glycerate dehydrogenase [Candidatus Bathyarchaeota archaeon]
MLNPVPLKPELSEDQGMKVLVGAGKRNFPEDLAEELREHAEVEYASPGAPLYSELLREADAAIVGMETVDQGYLDKAPRLGIVARFGVGYDSVDVESCTRRGVHVTHTPGVLSGAVADLTWGLILSVMRGIPDSDSYVREEWANRARRLPFGADTEGKTLGILGLGRIGGEVAKRAQGFDVTVIYHDVVKRPELEASLGVEFREFDDLLEEADIVTIHVPLMPSTRGLIGRRELELMKSTAYIINTSRGPVIDQTALVEALEKSVIKGAGLDVFEVEPLPLGDRLAELENTVLTSHIGSATAETRRQMAVVCYENVKAFLKGETPPNLVPEQRS